MTSSTSSPLATPEQTPDGWSRVADAYDTIVAPFLARYAEDMLRLSDLRTGERVLDVAAGSGALSLLATARGARVLATDFAPAMVERLRRKVEKDGLDVRAEVMDGQALALEDASFDAVYSNFGLIFFPDRAAGFREMRRVLRPGGRAGVTAWSAPDRIEWFAMFQAALQEAAPDLPPPDRSPPVFSLADPDVFAREMREAGFRDVRIEPVRHGWGYPSPEAAWEALCTTNPVFPAMMARLGPERARVLEAAMMRRLRAVAANEGRGALELSGEALVGLGVR